MPALGGKWQPWFLLALALWPISGPANAKEPVPGLHQLVILDPQVDESGVPAVNVTEAGKVEIPPTVHVHPYYYTGKYEYQGPLIQGGPTVVVARHPKTNEMMYVDVMLPAGTPMVAYDKHAITYVYDDQRVAVEFSHVFPKKVSVKNLPGRGWKRVVHGAAKSIKEKIDGTKKRSKLCSEVSKLTKDTGKVIVGAGYVVIGAGTNVLERARALANGLPFVPVLKSVADQAGEIGDTEEIRQAGERRLEAEANEFAPTIR